MTRIRPASPGDAALLSALSKETVLETYAGPEHPREMLARYAERDFSAEKIARELRDPGILYHLAEKDGEPAGYSKLSWKAPPECVPERDAACLERLYLLRRHQGLGLGKLLLEHRLSIARERGCKAAWLSVWDRDEKALAFYAKHGFQKVGSWKWEYMDGYADDDLVLLLKI